VKVAFVPLEIDDRIPDQLAFAMERDIAAALDLEQLDASSAEKLRRRQKVLLLRGAAERDDRRMLEEQQDVFGYRPVDALPRDASL
jgi:hypothetical protein